MGTVRIHKVPERSSRAEELMKQTAGNDSYKGGRVEGGMGGGGMGGSASEPNLLQTGS